MNKLYYYFPPPSEWLEMPLICPTIHSFMGGEANSTTLSRDYEILTKFSFQNLKIFIKKLYLFYVKIIILS